MLTLKAKDFFFDRKSVQRAIVPAKLKFLSKVGAFVRRSAQTSMRYRKKASTPGQPPSAHKEHGALLRKLLWFAYDPSNDSVVVGPVAASRRAEAPRLNEFGGNALRRGKTVTYPARPFMAPALAKEEPKLPFYWTNSVRGDT
jgi:phage gpG-like protein